MHDLVNLIVDLDTDRFGPQAHARAIRSIEAAGFSVERAAPGSDAFLAWIDDSFGGAWSSEAFAGKNLIATRNGMYAGFVTYEARGLAYSWLRGAAAQPGTGLFGPFGVTAEFRGSNLGSHLLAAALSALGEAGYASAVIPAVGDEALIRYYAAHCGARVAERFDAATWNAKRRRTVVMASGNGSNFQSVIDGVRSGTLPLDLTLLVSNKPQAFALERARAAGIATLGLPWERELQSRPAYDAQLLEAVRRAGPELILLLGWMHVLDERFVLAFPHVINIHPAFLPLDQDRDDVGFPDGFVTPAFRGAHAVRDALKWGSRWVGASSHRVTPDTDRGPVLVRKPLPIESGEAQEAIMEQLHPLEHRVLAGGIRRWIFEQ